MAVGSRLAVLFSAALAFVGVARSLRPPRCRAATVSVACGSVGAEFDLCKTGAGGVGEKPAPVKVVFRSRRTRTSSALFPAAPLAEVGRRFDVTRIDIRLAGPPRPAPGGLEQGVRRRHRPALPGHHPAIPWAGT